MTSSHKTRRRKSHQGERSSPAAQPTKRAARRSAFWTLPLAAIVAIGVAVRLYYMRQPMRYDESVTYLYFAGKSWATVVTTYTYPNNHVFHSVLVKVCATLLGADPWVLRLPAFVAGIVMIPATYSVGRRLFGSAAAHIGAGLVAASGALALYSTNARGYTMICLATLLLADLVLRLREQSSIRRWAAVVVVIALGMWTVPVMMFPAGGLMLWFALSALGGDTSQPRRDLARLVVATVVAGMFTFLLYAPIIDHDGWAALSGNSFVRGSSMRVFFRQIALSIGGLRDGWALGFPVAIWATIGACAIVGVVNERKTNGIRMSLAGSMYVWCAVVLLVTHRSPFIRVWLFLVAPIALYAGHGLMTLASLFAARHERVLARAREASVVLALALAGVLLLSRAIDTSRDTGTLRDAKRITASLSGKLRPGDRVFAPIPSNAPLAFYFVRAGVDTSYLSSSPTDSGGGAYLVVNTAEGYTVNSPLGDRRLQRFSRAKLLEKYPSAEIYRLF